MRHAKAEPYAATDHARELTAQGRADACDAGTYLAARFTRARLNPDLAWADVFALAVLAGIGFTVALLIGELAFTDPAAVEHIKAAVLLGSLIAATVAALLIKRRNGIYRRLWEAENRDEDADGIPDIYQRTPLGRDGTESTG